FHKFAKRKRRAARSQSVRGTRILLDRIRPTNSHQRTSGENVAGRIAKLFSFPTDRQPARSLGVAPERSGRRTSRIGRADGRDDRALWREAHTIAATLGWLPSDTRYDRILAGPPKPSARSISLPATKQRQLVDRTTRAVK